MTTSSTSDMGRSAQPPSPSPSRLQRFIRFPLTRLFLGLLAVGLALAVSQAALLGTGEAVGWEGPVFNLVANAIIVLITAGVYSGCVRWIERRQVTELSTPGALQELGLGLLVGSSLFTTTIGIIWLLGSYRVVGTNP